jgi:hypothetical protein
MATILSGRLACSQATELTYVCHMAQKERKIIRNFSHFSHIRPLAPQSLSLTAEWPKFPGLLSLNKESEIFGREQ